MADVERIAGDDEFDPVGLPADALNQPPKRIAKEPPLRGRRDEPPAGLLRDDHHVGGRRREARQRRFEQRVEASERGGGVTLDELFEIE